MQTFQRSPLAILLIVIAAVAVALVVALSAAGLTHAGTVSVSTTSQSGLTVCGHGQAFVRPDVARIHVGVHASASTADVARAQASQTMTAVLAALKANGVATADIQTAYFAIEPEYSYDQSGSHQIGYTVTNSVTVTVRAVDKVGQIVDAAAQAAGNNADISGIDFSTIDPNAGIVQAQQQAIANAHAQAEQLASTAGVALGAPLAIDAGSCSGQTAPLPSSAQAAGSSAAQPTTPVQPGQSEVDAEVLVIYAIH
jgi:uncharacterized protein YggE